MKASLPSWGALPLLVLLPVACGLGVLDPISTGSTPTPTPTSMPTPNSEMGLVAHWSFDESAGQVVHDLSGNSHDGMLTGGVWLAGGRFGGALRLLRGDHFVVPAFPDATASFTLSLWAFFSPGDVGAERTPLIGNDLNGGGWEVNLPDGANHYQFNYMRRRDAGQSDRIQGVCCRTDSDRWMHITTVVDGPNGLLTVYEGTTLQMTAPVAAPIMPGGTALYIASTAEVPMQRLFQGAIDEIRVYSRALSAAEVAHLDATP